MYIKTHTVHTAQRLKGCKITALGKNLVEMSGGLGAYCPEPAA